MKKGLFALPVLATAVAIAANAPGFIMGGPQPGWTLAVTMGYLLCWAVFLRNGTVRWQRIISRIWWIASAVCSAACFCVVTFDLDGFLMIFPALGLVSPLLGIALCVNNNYPVFYGFCTFLAVWNAIGSRPSLKPDTKEEVN